MTPAQAFRAGLAQHLSALWLEISNVRRIPVPYGEFLHGADAIHDLSAEVVTIFTDIASVFVYSRISFRG